MRVCVCVCEFIYTHFYYYVKMLKQTYFVRELGKRAASSGCSCPAVLLLSCVCVFHLFASFVSAKVFCTFVQIHSIWHPLPATSSNFCCYCCIASLNTLANILSLCCRLAPASVCPSLPPSACTFRRLIRLFNAFLRFCSTVGFSFLSRVGGGMRGGDTSQTHLRITKRCFYMLNGKSNL